MKTPAEIAQGITSQFSWTSNVIYSGHMTGQQFAVGAEIIRAIAAERAEAFAREKALRIALGRAATTLIAVRRNRVKPDGRAVKAAIQGVHDAFDTASR